MTPTSPDGEATSADPGKIVQMDGLPCACRFLGVEAAIRQGSETGVLVDPDDPIRECALHKALRARVVELAGALDGLLDAVKAHNEANERVMVDPHSTEHARTVLAATPAKALERAKIINYITGVGDKYLKELIAKLDALGKEGG